MIEAAKINTKRLALDPFELADEESIFEIARDKQSIEDFQYTARTIEDVRAWLEPSYNDPATLQWVIRKQGSVIGFFEVSLEAEYSDLQNGVCRIGYFLDRREQGQGFGTEALQAVTDWLFRTSDVIRVEAGVTVNNIPSCRILEKAGFIREKVVPKNWTWHGQTYDSAYYYLSKPGV